VSPRRRTTPSRDSFPPPQPRRAGPGPARPSGRKPFGSTWWAKAWVDALEGRARLDPNRLPRGRTYARTGAAGQLTLQPGEVSAPVQGSRAKPYQVTVRVRTFDDHEWTRVLDAFAAEIGHTAALLDGELPPAVAADATGVGLDLLPGPGEIQPRCSCPDWADPCKHAAAVCYLVADELDRDPFGILLLRGRSREEVLAALRARRSSTATTQLGDGRGASYSSGDGGAMARAADPGVPARAAWRRDPADTPPAPLPPMPPEHPGRPPILPADVPAGSGIDAGALRALAVDAAGRAHELAQGARTSGLELTASEDLARRAAALVGPRWSAGDLDLEALAGRAGQKPRELLRQALAWQEAGRSGLRAYHDEWDPEPEILAEGRNLLGTGSRARHNRVTLGERQLRLGQDDRWYSFRRASDGGWDPDGAPQPRRRAADKSRRPDTDDHKRDQGSESNFNDDLSGEWE
jgi:uncharacterized Zn finger protein